MATPHVADRRDTEFRVYPTRLLMGVVDEMADAEAAIADLLHQGIANDDIHTWFDEAGVETIDPEGAQHGLVARFWRGLQHATGEHATLEHYAQEIAKGHVCIGVHCESSREAGLVKAILDRHAVHFVNYHGLTIVELLKA